MPSVAQAASAVGSFALVVVVLMVWWWSDTKEKTDVQNEAYQATAEKVANLKRKQASLEDDIGDITEEHDELAAIAKKFDNPIGGDSERVAKLSAAVKALQARADRHRGALVFLSWALGTDEMRTAEIRDALGTPLIGDRILLHDIEEKAGAWFITGAALSKADFDAFSKRLDTSAYFAERETIQAVQKGNPERTRLYTHFKISVALRAPALTLAGGGDDE